MPDDLETAKAEFNTALPDWWCVVEESEGGYTVTVGSNADADDTHTYRVLKPASAAEALRAGLSRFVAARPPLG